MKNLKQKLAYVSLTAVAVILLCITFNQRNTQADSKALSDEEKAFLGIEEDTSYEIYQNNAWEGYSIIKVIKANDWEESLYLMTKVGSTSKIEQIETSLIIDDISFLPVNAAQATKKENTLDSILLAVTSSSHTGNGSTEFYRLLSDGTLQNVLTAEHTVDRDHDTTDGCVYENGRLTISIQDQSDGTYQIQFLGRAYYYGVSKETNEIMDERLYQIALIERSYLYDAATESYIELNPKSELIETNNDVISYHEYWSQINE